MTAIAGFTDGHKVWIGADSAASAGHSIAVRRDPKVFRIGKAMLCGFQDSFRMGQILRYHVTPPRRKARQTDIGYLVTQFVPRIREAFAAHGYGETIAGQETGGAFIIGYRGGLYHIDSDYQVGTYADDYFALGSGSDLVLGAFHALAHVATCPRSRVVRALEAAAEYNSAVRAPFHVEEI